MIISSTRRINELLKLDEMVLERCTYMVLLEIGEFFKLDELVTIIDHVGVSFFVCYLAN